jgi:hypothetical protein
MKNVSPAFEITDHNVEHARSNKVLIGYQEIKCHLVFDIKMEVLVCEARFVAGGHTTEAPDSITYISVVSRDSVPIAFLHFSVFDSLVFDGRVEQRQLQQQSPILRKQNSRAGMAKKVRMRSLLGSDPHRCDNFWPIQKCRKLIPIRLLLHSPWT